MTALAFVLAAGLGATIRWAVQSTDERQRRAAATLAVNVVGAFGLGWLVANASSSFVTSAGVGGMGTLTTFSTLALDLDDLPRGTAVSYLLASVVLGLGAAWAGLHS